MGDLRAVIKTGDNYVFAPETTRDDAHDYFLGEESVLGGDEDGRVVGM